MQQKHFADVQVVIMTAKNSLLLFSSIMSYTKREALSQGFLGGKVTETGFTNNFHVFFVGLYSHTPIYSCYKQ